jgi:PAS domain S-box-containing protein
MDLLPTLPRRTWLERVSLVLATSLVVVGGATLAGWVLHNEQLLQPFAGQAPLRANSAACLFVLGLTLLAIELGWRRLAWLALVPAALSTATLAETFFQFDLHIDEILGADFLPIETAAPGRMAAVIAICLLAASIALAWRAAGGSSRRRLLSDAVIGSMVASAGFSTLLGYVAGLHVAYFWGSNTATPPMAAIALVLLGLALLALAWRESTKSLSEPPAWSPMPATIGCLTVTIVLWVGLRERELAYLNAKTQTAMDSLAGAIAPALDDQINTFERLARRWSDGAETDPVIWEFDAKNQMAESARVGCVDIAVVDSTLHTQWIYPPGNSRSLDFDHSSSPERRDALEKARLKNSPVVSGTTKINSPKKDAEKGFVIYAPISRAGHNAGFVAGEFAYSIFFRNLIARQPALATDYHVNATIGEESVYDSGAMDIAAAPEQVVEHTYVVFDRRVRLSLAPTSNALSHGNRFLPEMALIAGFGITVLLGLSVHLARSARAGQHAAEQSNKKLLDENEERRRIEARLKVSDERLRLALDSTQIGIFEWSVAAGQVYYSPGLWAMLGYDHGRMPSTVEAWQSLIHPDDLALYRRRTESQLSGIASFIEPEYRVRARSGDWRWVYTRAKSVATGPNGQPTRIIGTVQDITARREAEQALRESQAEARKLSLVASRTDNPVLIGSPNGNIEWVNDAFCRVMEYSLEEVIGKNPSTLMSGPETDPHISAQIQIAITRGIGISTDVVNYSKSGRKYYLHLEIQPVRGASGELQNFIAIETDITARVETEQQLRRAKSEADDASRAKSEFLASMSHEIRTPMNGVIGMTSLLMETTLTTEQRDYVHTIRNSGEALLTIINDILDFSKIESGKMELEHSPLDLGLCIEEALDLFAVQATAKKLELAYCLGSSVPPWIVGDVTRIRQVIVNLVNNAIKFTPSGCISITVETLGAVEAGQPARLEFAVRDTGIGIPADRVDRLFKAFSQVDSSTTRKYGGTGLGLAICQRLCQLMGGDIRVESAVGAGSTFFFTVQAEPARVPSEAGLPPTPAGLIESAVICVEDFPVHQQRISSLFANWGVACHIAADLATATQIAAELRTPPALLIIDYGALDGLSPLEILPTLKCPRLLMVPFGQTPSFAAADGMVFTTVAKPLKHAVFVHAAITLLSPGSAATTQKTPVSERPLAEEFPLDVLLAEDNPVNQKVALRFLERLGYRADAVGNGLEAVTTLENRRYDLVLMDLQMPEMDGLQASREIRRRLSASRQPKIIALTANAMQGDRELCLAAGMDDYISKPVKMPEIAAAIRRQFGKPVETPVGERLIG